MVPPHLKLFGVPELRRNGVAAPFRTSKQLALLVYLTLEARDRGVSRARLVELLWPEVPAERGRHSLSQGLSVIRHLLGAGAVTRARATVQLLAEIVTDLDRLNVQSPELPTFDQPLRDLDTCAGPAFAHWVDATRQQCVQLARSRLMRGLAEARAAGQVRTVHERAALLYQVDPLSDAAALALAEQMSLTGDRVSAVRLLRRHLRRLEHEEECEPSAEVRRRLLRLERASPTKTGRCAAEGRDRSGPKIFVGREDDLAALESLWTRVESQGLVTFLVAGPAGIGKSTLVGRFAESIVSRGWPTFTVACQEIGRAIPFAAISDLIYALSRDASVGGTDPCWLSEVSRVTPGIKALYPGIPEPPPISPESVRVRVAESIMHVLEVLADGGPILLVFDDGQHMDPATRDVLHVLLRRLQATPTLLVVTLRTNDAGQVSFASGADFAGFAWNRRVVLRPLSPEHARALIEVQTTDADGPDCDIAGKMVELADGNPYLLEMLLSDWLRDRDHSLVAAEVRGDGTGARWRPPDTMRRAFRRQYHGLSGAAQRLLAVLAVAGRQMTVEEIGRLASLDAAAVDRATVEALDRGLLRVERGSLSFKNEIHRAFVYFASLTDDSRRYHHDRLAESLGHQARGDDFQRALEASHHLLRAGRPDDAVTMVGQGAEVAIATGAPNEAERALKEVIGAVEGDAINALQILLARSVAAQGRYRETLEILNRIDVNGLSLVERATTDAIRAEALHRGRLGSDQEIAEATKRALATARVTGSDILILRALQITAEVAADAIDLEGLLRLQDTVHRMRDESSSDEVTALACLTEGFCLMVTGAHNAAITELTRSEGILQSLSWDVDLRMVANGLGICHTNLGNFKAAEAAFKEAIAIANRLGDSMRQSHSYDNLAVLYDDLGWFERAAKAYRRALELCGPDPTPRQTASLLSNAATLSITLGNFSEANELLNSALEIAYESRVSSLIVAALAGKADLHVARAEHELAWKVVEDLQATTGGKVPLDGNAGHYARLLTLYTWATKGLDAALDVLNAMTSRGIGNRLATRLEIRTFREHLLTKHSKGSAALGV